MTENIIIKTFPNAKNWGDKIAPYLVEMISGKKVKQVNIRKKYQGKEDVHLTVGSVLEYADSKTIVWGAGFIREGDRTLEPPQKIYAVRGPLTRERLLELNIDCPEVYGDPTLLLPKYYVPKKTTKAKVGIVPHFVDKKNPWLRHMSKIAGVKIINIENDCFKVIDEICSCEVVASSSLHGLIIAEAYGIPTVWIKLSDEVWGGNFKFNDYFLSVGPKKRQPLIVGAETSLDDIRQYLYVGEIKIDLQKLYQVCPFSVAKAK